VLTEYGIADLRGRSDAEVAAAMIEIADSRFQAALVADAKRAGKLSRGYVVPEPCRRNLPEVLEQALAPHRAEGRFGTLPYGTDLSPEEIRLGGALRGLKARSETWGGRLAIAAKILRPLPRDAALSPLFERMNLAAPRGMRERLLRRLVAAALKS
jgi:hypothetical protein